MDSRPFAATRRQVLLGASAAISAAPGIAAQNPPEESSANIQAAMRVASDLRAMSPMPALSLAVARSTGLLWAEAYGQVDLELNVSATPVHRFKLGSVSKVIAATAAARLASRGVVGLDVPIVHWLPGLPEQHRQTTLRQLLTHRGGVRHYDPARDFSTAAVGGTLDQRGYLANREILDIFINDPLVAPPGDKVVYSTFGYTLASIVMESAADQPFPELIKAEIGAHFGVGSLEEDDPFALKAARVRGYGLARDYTARNPRLKDGWANAPPNNPAYKWAGGGLIMTPADLAQFGAALLDSPNARITHAERALLFTPMTQATQNSAPLGLGWRIDHDARGRPRWHHAGNQEGCRAGLVIYPSLALSIALASNATGIPADILKPSSDLADAFSA